MFNHITLQLHVLLQLLKRDLKVYFSNIDNYINTACWTLLSLLVYHFILPHLGLKYDGTFFLVGCVVSKAFYGMMDNSIIIIADLTETKSISYDMTLPLSHTLLFIKIALSNMIYSFFVALAILPIGKLMLWNQLHFPHFHLMNLLLIVFTTATFVGFFSLFIIGYTKSLQQIEDVYSIILFPLSSFGCSQFTWKSMFAVSPFLAYLNLCNPVMYMFEGVRAATLEPSLSLPYWICCIALLFYSLPMGYIGVYLLKKRLDAI